MRGLFSAKIEPSETRIYYNQRTGEFFFQRTTFDNDFKLKVEGDYNGKAVQDSRAKISWRKN
jgi:hypothetical protein